MPDSSSIDLPLFGPWEWAKHMPRDAYRALGDNQSRMRGEEYFLSGAVLDLSYDVANHTFFARVRGKRIYQVEIGDASSSFYHYCDCPVHDMHAACKHVFAVVAWIYLLTQGTNVLLYAPPERHLIRLARSLSESVSGSRIDTSSRQTFAFSGDPDDRIRSDARPYLVLEVEDGHPSISPEGCNPNAPGFRSFMDKVDSYLAYTRRQFDDQPYPLVMREVLSEMGADLCVRSEGSELVRLNGTYETHASDGMLDLQTTANRVVLSLVPDDDLEDLWPLDPFFFKTDGTLVAFEARFQSSVPSMMDSTGPIWLQPEELKDPRCLCSIDQDTFNRYTFHFKSTELAGDHISLAVDGHPSASLAELKPIRVRAKVSIQHRPKTGGYVVSWSYSADDLTVPLDFYEQSVQRFLAYDEDARVLFRAQRRCSHLIHTMRLLLITPKSKAKAVIKEACQHSSLTSAYDMDEFAGDFLKSFTSLCVFKKSNHHLFATESGWALLNGVGAAVCQVLIGVRELERETLNTEYVDESLFIAEADFPAFIRRVVLLSQACDFDLEFDDAPVAMAPVAIQVEAQEGEKIDWFELKAEVRCGDLNIDASEWDALIRGELLLTDEDGKLVIPHLEQDSALGRLRELFGPVRNKKSSATTAALKIEVQRLQILDWIDLRKNGVQLKLPAEAEAIFERLRQFDRIPKQAVPKSVEAKLRDYQKRGFDWMSWLYGHRFGACLADDMGLGKTLQAITFLSQISGENGRKRGKVSTHLVVLPPSLVFNWLSEIERFCPTLSVYEYLGSDRSLDRCDGVDVVLTTYDTVRRDISALEKTTWDIVVLDEVQALKNVNAVRTQAVSKLKRRFTLCLTGTPMENHVGEYYSIMHLCLPGIFGQYAAFRKQLKEGEDHVLRRARPFVLRRTKEEILKELPPKVESEIYLDMTEEQREIYTRTVGEVRAEVMAAYKNKTKAQAGIVALPALLRLRQVCVSPEIIGKPVKQTAPKLSFLLERMEELQNEGSSALLFSQFTRTLDLLEDVAHEHNLPVLRLDGSTPAKKRKEVVRTFQESDTPKFFLISLKAGGVGLNLTRAQYVFHVDPWWNPAVERQASDRAHRMGQQKTVFIQRLIMRHTIEEKIMLLKERKQAVFDQIINSGDASIRGSSMIGRDDIDLLLS